MFQSDETLSKVDAVVSAVGQGDDVVYSKSTSLQVNIADRWILCQEVSILVREIVTVRRAAELK